MIVLTGGAGFIGSCFLAKLNAERVRDALIVDVLESSTNWLNLRGKRFQDYLHRDRFLALLQSGAFHGQIEAIVHMGACSNTTESNVDFLMENNYRYSRSLAEYALLHGIRFIYASSAATYGDGTHGYSDDINGLEAFVPLNPYGFSKHLFDLWVARNGYEHKVCGLKFFNVFGPNEYHKTGMLSGTFNAFTQMQNSGKIRLFNSHSPAFKDGEQQRDFVYVKDCVEVLWWLLTHPAANGIFNLGSGVARTWNEMAQAVCAALGKPVAIEYIEMPEVLRPQYQYRTQAEMGKLSSAGCPVRFHSLEEATLDYVQGYLTRENQYW